MFISSFVTFAELGIFGPCLQGYLWQMH